MPLTKWCVEPVFLSRKPIPPDKTRINELECNNNNTLVGILRQLSSLVKISDKIFYDLSEDCHQICDRTLRLKSKLDHCENLVNQLNAKSVKVPVGNFNAFIKIETHYKSSKELTNNSFTIENRPQCIKDAYLAASITPIHIIRAIDSYRDDGRCGSKLFMCQPVFSNSRKKVNFDIETRRPASLVFAHELPRNVIIERAKTPLCNRHQVFINREVDSRENSSDITRRDSNISRNTINSNGNVSDADSQTNPLYGLISPEEQMQVISREYPSKYVPIDVTGVGLSRMSHLRRSLIHADFLIRRKKSTLSKGKRVKRRNTICQSANELSVSGNENRKNRIRRRSTSSIDFVNNSCQTEVNENEIYSSGRIVEVIKCKNKSTDLLNESNVNNNNNDENTYDNYKRENKIKLKAEVHHYESRSLDNLIDDNHKHQSVGSDESEMINSNETVRNLTENNHQISDKCKNQNSIPISSLSVAMNAVKMRESLAAKGVADDGRSSSGNWSASSSTHASVDSDQVINSGQSLKNDLPHNLSNSSLGKDSVISDSNTTPHDNDGRLSSQETNSCNTETSHFNCINNKTNKTENKALELGVNDKVVIRANNSVLSKVQYANRDSESWLQYYDSSETITPTPTESESGQTIQVSTSCCGSSRRSSFSAIGRNSNDDEAESVYSVDNDGYYTSMHTDSGLFRVPVKLMITPNSSFRCKGKRDSIASNCTVGDISINSILSKTETESSTTTLTNNSSNSSRTKLPPPPPPPRVSSMLRSMRNSMISNKTNDSGSDNGTPTSNTSVSSRSHSPSPATTITSESEHSDVSQRRLKAKTIIDSSRYPSMCAITSNENSDDGKSADSYSSDGSHRLTPTRKMMRLRSGSYKGFRIKDIFGFGQSFREERNSPITVPTVPHIATIRRPQSPLRFNMYNGEGGQRVKRFAEKFAQMANANTSNQYKTPNIIRVNAISSFSSDSNECSIDEQNSYTDSSKCSAIKVANNEKMSDTSDLPEKQSNTSKSVPNPSPRSSLCSNSNPKISTPNETVSKVPQNALYPISRHVSVQNKRNDSKPLTSPKPTITASISRPTTLSIPVSNAYNSHRSVARVTLDANGCVIYASNSLGRRRDGHPMNYLNQIQKTAVKIEDDQRCATLPKASKPRVSSPLTTKAGAMVHINPNGYVECTKDEKSAESKQSTRPLSPVKTSNGQTVSKTSMSDRSHVKPVTSCAPVSRCVTPVVKQKPRPRTPAIQSNQQNILNSSKAIAESDRKSPATVSFANKSFMESDLNEFVPNSTSSPITPVSPRDNHNNGGDDTSNKSDTSTLQRRGRLTTEDLLIIIHNSKKKHNIKTEPEIIIANSPPSTRSQSSSSSNSPGSSCPQILSRPNTPSRTSQPFSPINKPDISDRRSWNGSETPTNGLNQAGNRRSLASDRLGTNRPTTMNDFKRLLSQTRSNNFNTDRLSAAEILRANSKRPLTPVINCITSFVGNNKKCSPQTHSRISPTSTTGPPPQISSAISSNAPNIIKPRIINGRAIRSPYRHESVCPPILEDCSEESDDKKGSNSVKQRLFASKLQKPVINNYNKVAANPQSTSTWV